MLDVVYARNTRSGFQVVQSALIGGIIGQKSDTHFNSLISLHQHNAI